MGSPFKRLFCEHETKICITNIHGDWINTENCRSIWQCADCGKFFKSDELCKECKIVNFHIIKE